MFVELLGRSCFSFLRGASRPEELIAGACQLGLSGFALCDVDGLYGAVRAWKVARTSALQFIVGTELTLARARPLDDVLSGASGGVAALPEEGTTLSLALLVQNLRGYENLCRLLTKSHEGQEKGKSVGEVSWLRDHSEGLFALLVAPQDPRRLALGAAELESQLSVIQAAFGARLAVATYRHRDGYDRTRQIWARSQAQRLACPITASARPSYHEASRKPLSDVLYCIRHGMTLDEAEADLEANSERHLRSEPQMRHLFRDHPEWIDEAEKIAASCTFDFSELRYHFPCELAEGQSADERLAELTWQGVEWRFPAGIGADLREQLFKELCLIKKIGVAPYFLSTYDIVEIARRRKILCQGRGSAANSAVCYMLGITAVDPSRSTLLFERFLSEERAEPPDIDIDFEHERREEVIQEIYERYGRDRAAMVSEIISYRGKSALREVSQVFGLSLDQADRLSGTITWQEAPEAHEKRLIEAGFDLADPRLRQVVALAEQLRGFPRHLSIHVGGFVLSSRPLYEVAPIEPARMEGRTVIPWDKDDIDALGFFKVDVLSLGMLTAIRKALGYIVEDGGLRAEQSERLQQSAQLEQLESFDPLEQITRIPLEDSETYRMISRGDTVGVFQIESRAQMAMLPRLRPSCFYDLVIEVAIVRPGPIQGGMVHPFLRRRNQEERITCPHIDLWPILQRTLGVPLFQEQVMQIAIVGAGYSGGEADQLRRDMAAWKKHGRLLEHKERLLDGFRRKGIAQKFGEALFEQIKGFGEYGFPESHASSFALLVYASSWQKCHYPAHFTCALLNSQPMGFYQPTSLVRDAQAHGVEVRDVCVVRSDWDCTLEEVSPQNRIKSRAPGAGRALRLGLRLVKGLGEQAGVKVMQAREEQSFISLADLIRRTGLKADEVEALAEAGAFGLLESERRQALWKARAPRTGGLFEHVAHEEETIVLPVLQPAEQLVMDYGRKGLSVEDHPLRYHRKKLNRLGAVRASDLFYLPKGRKVQVAGLVMMRQRPATASGVVFITLEDETGSVNLIVYSSVFEKYHHIARHSQMLLIAGEIERDTALPVAQKPPVAKRTAAPQVAAGAEVAAAPDAVQHEVAAVFEPKGDEQIPVIHVIVKHIERWGNSYVPAHEVAARGGESTKTPPNQPAFNGFSRDFH